jgi:hypothetical protein
VRSREIPKGVVPCRSSFEQTGAEQLWTGKPITVVLVIAPSSVMRVHYGALVSASSLEERVEQLVEQN